MLNKMKLKARFITLFLLIGLVPVIAASIISFTYGRSNIQDEVFRALGMYAQITGVGISDYFDMREKEARVIVASENIYRAMNALRNRGFDDTDQEWLAAKSTLDSFARQAERELGYGFIFLTDPQGKAVFSTEPAVEGADLSGREYLQKSLRGQTNWSDYFFSNVINENALVLSLPVRSNGLEGELVGTINFVLKEADIDKIVHEGIGELGTTADAYLVNAEGLLLTNTLRGELARDASLQETVETEATGRLSAPLGQGDTNFLWQGFYENYLGETVLGTVKVVRFGNGLAGLVVEKNELEALAGVYRMRSGMLLALLLTAFVVVAAGYFLAVSTARPIASITDVAKKVAAGDFTISTEIRRSDEIGELAKAFNTMSRSLRELILQAVVTAASVNEGSDSLSRAVENISASLEEIAASTNQFAANTEKLSTNAQEMSAISSKVSASAVAGSSAVENAAKQMHQINALVEVLGDIIKRLDQRSQSIGSIVDMITEVAEQTNLLALNAAIEAARVGEQGRGFAVVAEEVRKLAEQSSKSADEISRLVREIQVESGDAVNSMQDGVEKVRAGTEIVAGSGEIFKEIVSNVERLTRIIGVVSASTEEISAGSEEIAASTQEQSSVMEEINKLTEGLRTGAIALNRELSKFRYSEN